MPGLAGIISNVPCDVAVTKGRVERMTDSLCHFDDYHVSLCETNAAGMRAALVSLPIRGLPVQEYRDADAGMHVLLDGELANGRELAANKHDAADPDNGASVVAGLYRQMPDLSFLPSLNGWFTALLYDKLRQRVVLFNDRYGIQPLYYHHGPDKLVFSGEVKGVLAGLPAAPDISPEGVADQLAFDGVLNEKTLFKHVFRMPPASVWVREREKKWEKKKYRDLAAAGSAPRYAPDEVEPAAQQVMERIIPRYLRGDYLLSLTGGNDTRLMMAFLDRGQPPAGTFTYGLSPKTADVRLAKRVARTLGLPHECIEVRREFLQSFPEYADKAVWFSDGMGDILSATILHVHGAHRNRIVAGGKYGTQVARGVRQRVWDLAGLGNLGILAKDVHDQVKDSPAGSLRQAREPYAGIASAEDAGLLFTIVEECRHHWGGKLAMENAFIRPRTPFTDHEFLDFVLRLPEGATNDAALQQALIRANSPALARIPTNRGLLPDTRSRLLRIEAYLFKVWFLLATATNSRRVHPKLRLDLTPFANNATSKFRTWFRGELAEYLRLILLDRRTLRRGWFDPDVLRGMLDRHIGRQADHSAELAKAVSLELFFRQFADGDRCTCVDHQNGAAYVSKPASSEEWRSGRQDGAACVSKPASSGEWRSGRQDGAACVSKPASKWEVGKRGQ